MPFDHANWVDGPLGMSILQQVEMEQIQDPQMDWKNKLVLSNIELDLESELDLWKGAPTMHNHENPRIFSLCKKLHAASNELGTQENLFWNDEF